MSDYTATLNSLASLAQDLKRAALGLNRGSAHVAARFLDEAVTRREEVNVKLVDPYIREIVTKLTNVLGKRDSDKNAEEILMYSTLLQNYVTKRSSR